MIDPSCKDLITDLEVVLRDQGGGIKKTTKKTDPYFLRTHFSDALGYWISYEAPVNYFANTVGNHRIRQFLATTPITWIRRLMNILKNFVNVVVYYQLRVKDELEYAHIV